MNKPIRIALPSDYNKCVLDGFDPREGCRFPGAIPEIIDYIMKYANLSYTIIPMSDELSVDSGDVINRTDSGLIWDGSLGEIQKGTYDTEATYYYLNTDRLASFAFTTPLHTRQFMYVIGPPQASWTAAFRLFTIFRPTLTVLVLGTLAVLLCGIIATQILHAKRKKHTQEKNVKMNTFHQLILILEVKHADGREKRFTAEKLFLLLFGLTVMLFINLYEGCLLTSLLLPPSKLLMKESQVLDLVSQRKLTFIIQEWNYNNQGSWQAIRFSKEEKLKKFQAALKENPPILVGGYEEVLQLFSEKPESYVYVEYSHLTDIFPDSNCTLRRVHMRDPAEFRLGLVFRKNSTAIVHKINEAVHKNLPFVQSINDYYDTFNITKCYPTASDEYIGPLGLLTLFSSFTLLFLGFIFAVCSLFFEIISSLRKRARLRKKEKIKGDYDSILF